MRRSAPADSNSSLLRELFDWMLVPLIIAWPISILLSYLIAASVAERVFDRGLDAKVRSLAENIVVDPATRKVTLAIDLRGLLADDDAAAHEFRVDDQSGIVLGSANLPSATASVITPPAKHNIVLDDRTVNGVRVRVAVLTMVPSPDYKPIVVQLSELAARRESLASEMLLSLLPLQLLAIPLAALFAYLGLKHGVKPLKRLSDDLLARHPSDFNPIDTGKAPAEVMPLVEGFNQLLARVESENIRQQRFIDNAAHQLRTPLAGLQLTTELALRSVNDADRSRALESIHASAKRSAHTIDQLLLLTRVEHTERTTFEEVHLATLIPWVVDERLADARSKNIDLGANAVECIATVRGNPALLRELISNLVDNAIRYTPRDGTVTVGISATDSIVTLSVEDDGPGIQDVERDRIWERFYRGMQTPTEGTGLGLAVVKEIADSHDALVTLTTGSSGRGARFEVMFPRR